jgi:hypothetical protein
MSRNPSPRRAPRLRSSRRRRQPPRRRTGCHGTSSGRDSRCRSCNRNPAAPCSHRSTHRPGRRDSGCSPRRYCIRTSARVGPPTGNEGRARAPCNRCRPCMRRRWSRRLDDRDRGSRYSTGTRRNVRRRNGTGPACAIAIRLAWRRRSVLRRFVLDAAAAPDPPLLLAAASPLSPGTAASSGPTFVARSLPQFARPNPPATPNTRAQQARDTLAGRMDKRFYSKGRATRKVREDSVVTCGHPRQVDRLWLKVALVIERRARGGRSLAVKELPFPCSSALAFPRPRSRARSR